MGIEFVCNRCLRRSKKDAECPNCIKQQKNLIRNMLFILSCLFFMFLLLTMATGCITVLSCEEAGHRFFGDECMRCGQHVPWLTSR